jgi:hypothetical protein
MTKFETTTVEAPGSLTIQNVLSMQREFKCAEFGNLTLYQIYLLTVSAYPNHPFLGHKEKDSYSWITYSESLSIIDKLSPILIDFKELGILIDDVNYVHLITDF